MDAIGAQELSFPALLPREPYEATGRWTEYGDNIFRLKDRKGGDYLLGPTHEEMFTLTVKDLYSSYKDLPLSIYQIQTKYRDEARPRAGLLRGREFIMKDSYSFDVDDAGLEASYQLHRDAYIRIFDRLGFALRHRRGHVGRHGRLALRGVPRDRRERRGHLRAVHALRLRGERRGRAGAGPRRGAVRRDARRPRRGHPRHPDHRDAGRPPQRARSRARTAPGRPATPSRTSSSCWCTPTAPASRSPSACPATATSTRSGSRPRCDPAEVAAVRRGGFAANPALVKGYIGPRALGEEGDAKVRYLLDPRVVEGTRWVTGADEPGRHVIDLVAGRDFTADGTIEAAEVRAGDVCPSCGEGIAGGGPRHRDGPHLRRSAEVRRGARPEGARPARQAGHRHHGLLRRRRLAGPWPPWPRATTTRSGLVWPRELSPADVHVVATGKDEEVFAKADEVATELERRGVEVLYDDRRKVSPGREVQGRRAHRGPDDRRRRPRAGRRRDRGPATGARRERASCRSTRRRRRRSRRSAAPARP